MKNVLVVDDEKPICDILKFNLVKSGYDVLCANDGEEGLRLALSENVDLILLDVMLPKIDGFEVLKRVREKKKSVPILMLTAREEEVDKILGLEWGADDYITKPFSMRELLARVKANLRRSDGANDGAGDGSLMVFGSLAINASRYEVTKNSKPVELTLREFELLKFMAAEPGKVFTREILLEKVWGYEYFGDVRTVDVTVRRLREKIEDDPAHPSMIMTKRGIGYYMNK